jgi:hypothetical protein
MKKEYSSPEWGVLLLSRQDILTVSPDENQPSVDDPFTFSFSKDKYWRQN